MKTLTTFIIALAATLSVSAQSNEFRIMVSKNQPLSTSFHVYGITVHFCSNGSSYTDGMDQQESIQDSTMLVPFTVDSSMTRLAFDARPQLRYTLNVPLGAFTQQACDMFIQGMWSTPGSEQLYDVLITDNINGGTYDLYHETMLPVGAATNFASQYTITFVPKALFVGFDESCFGQSNGSIYARSAQQNWTADLYLNNSFLRNIAIAGTDTLITNLMAGTYSIVFMLDGVPTDTANVIVGGPAPVVASASISNVSPLENELVTFTNTSSGAIDYAWDFGDGFTSTDTSTSHTYTTAGTYTVTLTAYNVTGCDNTVTYVITVNSGSFANNNSGPHYRSSMPGSSTARTVAPTVTAQEGQAHVIANSEPPVSSVTVYSLTGQMVYASQGSSNTYDFTYSTPGIYVVHYVYSDGSEFSTQVPLN